MKQINESAISKYISSNIKSFHDKLFDRLLALKLKNVLTRKNPYLFKAKALDVAHDLVKSILDAYLSSQEETIFGEFLEQLAIYICEYVYGGRKSASEGIDLEFERDGVRYIVSIKSGPNWGNSGQISKMRDHFKKAKRILGTNTSKINVVAINGCCYGKENSPDKGDYLKYCGQAFWELISGEPEFYTKIIEPLGHKAKNRNNIFNDEYAKVINRFTSEFTDEYCEDSGAINWKKLVKFNSGKE
jgi:hypothetical protein